MWNNMTFEGNVNFKGGARNLIHESKRQIYCFKE